MVAEAVFAYVTGGVRGHEDGSAGAMMIQTNSRRNGGGSDGSGCDVAGLAAEEQIAHRKTGGSHDDWDYGQGGVFLPDHSRNCSKSAPRELERLLAHETVGFLF